MCDQQEDVDITVIHLAPASVVESQGYQELAATLKRVGNLKQLFVGKLAHKDRQREKERVIAQFLFFLSFFLKELMLLFIIQEKAWETKASCFERP